MIGAGLHVGARSVGARRTGAGSIASIGLIACAWLVPAAAMAQAPRAVPGASAKPPATPAKAAQRPARAVVETTLTASNRPVGGREVAELGGRADEVLIEIASDPAAALNLRSRAVSAMAYTRTPTARTYLRNVIDGAFKAETAEDRTLVRKAALSYGWLGTPGAEDDLAPLLGHPDRDVRVDAGVALALTRQQGAVPALERHVDQEKDPWVRNQLTRQLETLRKSAGEPPRRRPPAYRPALPPPTHGDPTSPRIGGRP